MPRPFNARPFNAELGRCAQADRPVHRRGVQPKATPFRATISHTGRVRAAQPGSRKVTALMEAMENQRTVYHRSHRPWKSLRDYHTPAARRLPIHKRSINPGRECHQLIDVQRVSTQGCSPVCHRVGLLRLGGSTSPQGRWNRSFLPFAPAHAQRPTMGKCRIRSWFGEDNAAVFGTTKARTPRKDRYGSKPV